MLIMGILSQLYEIVRRARCRRGSPAGRNMERKSAIGDEYCKAPVKTPRFGWIVGASVCGVLIARELAGQLAQRPGRIRMCDGLYTLSGAIFGALVGVITEVVVFRLRFTVSQLLELFIVCLS